jgi:hypothetical protein
MNFKIYIRILITYFRVAKWRGKDERELYINRKDEKFT